MKAFTVERFGGATAVQFGDVPDPRAGDDVAIATRVKEEWPLCRGTPRGMKTSVSPGLRRACGARGTLIMSA